MSSGEQHRLSEGDPRLRQKRRLATLVFAEVVVVAVLAIVSQQVSSYYQYIFVYAGVYAIAVLGNNLLLSHVGQLSIGQGGLVAIGAYVAMITSRGGWSAVESIAAGTFAAGLAGLLVGLPAARLASQYLALVTLAFALAVSEILSAWPSVTGGSNGLPASGHTIASGGIYLVTFVLAAVALVTQELLLAGRVGRVLHLIRDSPRAAVAYGIPVSVFRLGAFTYAGLLAGLSGALLVSLVNYVSPDQFTFQLSIYILAAVVMAGLNRPLAALFGGMVIGAVPQLTTTSASAAPVILGGVLVIAILAQQLIYPWLGRLLSQRLRARSGYGHVAVAVAPDDGSGPTA